MREVFASLGYGDTAYLYTYFVGMRCAAGDPWSIDEDRYRYRVENKFRSVTFHN